MSHAFSHIEFGAKDIQKSAAFYEELFGWKIESMPGMPRMMIHAPIEGATPGADIAAMDGESYVAVYISVDDVQHYLDKAVSLGATVVVPFMEVPGMVQFALFKDPEGRHIGVSRNPQ